jgi:hypothetical protein
VGRRRGRPAAGAARGERRRREVGDDPDRWAPPVGDRVREREEGRGSGPCGPEGLGRGGDGGLGSRGRLDRFVFVFFFSFSNPFQIFLNEIFYIFSNSNFHTNFSNYFKGFSQTIFNNFSNIF